MKHLSLFFFAMLLFQGSAEAQVNSETSGIEVMALTISAARMDEISLKINRQNSASASPVDFSVYDRVESGLIMISARPYSNITLRIPPEAGLVNQFGETSALTNLRIIHGNSGVPDTMNLLSPGGCSELMIPETGIIYLRIGGTLKSSEPLRGVYTGFLDLKCKDQNDDRPD